MSFHPFRPILASLTRRKMIATHARWLSRVLRRGEPVPRIPARRVSEGGFSRLMSSPAGREYADRWWDDALERLPR